MPWPDLEAVLIRRTLPLVRDQFGEDVGMGPTVNLADLDAGHRYVRLHVIGGGDNGHTDRSRVDVECFAPQRPEAIDLAEFMRAALLAMSATSDPDGTNLLDRVTTGARPAVAPYRNPTTTRVVASYNVETRLQ